MANDKIIRLPTQAQATITAAQTGSIEIFADSGTGLIGSVDPAGVVTIYGLASIDEQQIIYVGKHGSDTNNGKSNAKAKLTFGAAITAAIAESPSSSNLIVIRCEDAGVYTENFSVPSWVKVDGEACDIVGNITLEGNTTLAISRLDVSSGIGVTKDTDTAHCLVNIGRIACTGTAKAMDVVSGVMMIEIDMITHVNGNAISNTAAAASEIRGFINHITSTGTGDAIAISVTAGNRIILKVVDIRGTGTGFDLDTGQLDVVISHFDPATGGDVASGASLKMIVADLNGKTFTGTGTIDITEAGVSELPVIDTTAIAKGSADDTKQMRIEVDGITPSTTRVLTMPDADITPDDNTASRPPSGAAGGDLGGTYPSPTVTDLTIAGEAQGDILYFNGTNWVRLAAGTAGQVLQTNGAAANPSWADAAGDDNLATWTPAMNEPPDTLAATFMRRNGHLVLEFDDSTDEVAIVRSKMKPSYNNEDVNVIIRFMMATATTGDVDLDAAFERTNTAGPDLDTDNFATPQSVLNTTVPGTSGVIGEITIPFTAGAQMDNIAAGDGFRLKIRNLSPGTATGFLQLYDLELRKQ